MKLWSREDDLVIGRLVGRLMPWLLLNDGLSWIVVLGVVVVG